MINPQRLSIVPTPVLRSAIFATGFVGLLATGPEGLQNKELQNTDAAPRADISAPSLLLDTGTRRGIAVDFSVQ